MYLNKILIFVFLAACAPGANAFLWFGNAGQAKTLGDARAASQRGDYALTADILEDFLLKDASKARLKEAYFLLGDAYKMQGAYDKALLKYAEAAEYFPADSGILLALGDVYAYGGLYENAHTAYQRVLDLDSNNKRALLAMARAHLADGSFTQAIAFFTRYQAAAPDDADALFYREYAQSYFMANNYAEAYRHAARADALAPSAQTKFLIAKIYKAQKKEQEAFAAIAAACAAPGADDSIHLTRALWLAYDGGQSEAIQIAERYLKSNPDDRLALFIKYFALHRLGREKEGQSYLRRLAAQDDNGLIESIARKILKIDPAPKTTNLKI